MVEVCDKQLAKDVVDGSEAAFRRLLDHHGPPISNFVRRMITQQAEAEDIVQETFLRFWLNADRYQPQKSKLSTWLHHIAYHLCIDHHRRSRGLGERHEEEIDPDTRPDDHYASSQTAFRVDEALSALPETQRCAVVLTHYQNFSNKEVAHILDISVDALESLLRRARSKLKQHLVEIRQ